MQQCTIPNNPSSNQDGNLWSESFVLKLKMHTNTPCSMDGMHHTLCMLEPAEHSHYKSIGVLYSWVARVWRRVFGICVKMKIAAHRCNEMNNRISNNNRTKTATETAQSVAAYVEMRNKSRRKEGISNENYYGNDKRPCCSKPPVVFVSEERTCFDKIT